MLLPRSIPQDLQLGANAGARSLRSLRNENIGRCHFTASRRSSIDHIFFDTEHTKSYT